MNQSTENDLSELVINWINSWAWGQFSFIKMETLNIDGPNRVATLIIKGPTAKNFGWRVAEICSDSVELHCNVADRPSFLYASDPEFFNKLQKHLESV